MAGRSRSEIFLEHTGTRFAHLLDYMRDGKVILPVTESREALIVELQYFGFDVDGTCVDDIMHVQRIWASHGYLQELCKLKTPSELEYRCL